MGAAIWWLVSYPKSGNTWLRAVVATLLSGQAADINRLAFIGPNAGGRFPLEDALGIDSEILSRDQETNLRPRAFENLAAEAARPLFCRTHDAYHLTPAGEPLFPAIATRGAVYVVRDPRAVAVSLAHYAARPVDDAITAMDDSAATFGGSTKRLPNRLRQSLLRWSDHVESWLAAPFPVHLLRYEDMQADPRAAFSAVAAFLDLPNDREAIAAAVEATRFSRLQAQERAVGFVEKPRQAAAFFREGTVDGWRRELTPEQAARLVSSHGNVMRRLGYDLTLAPLAAECGAA
jgi:aryl sulfotransferase